MSYATCPVSTEHTEQQSNRATEHSAGHVTQRSAVLAAGRDDRRRLSDLLPEASLQFGTPRSCLPASKMWSESTMEYMQANAGPAASQQYVGTLINAVA